LDFTREGIFGKMLEASLFFSGLWTHIAQKAGSDYLFNI